jgi:transposase
MEDSKTRSRRRHGADLKACVLAECAKPGASVAQVARAHGLNANLVDKWRRLAPAQQQDQAGVPPNMERFIALPLAPSQQAPAADIRIELRRGATLIAITWPASAAADCAQWLREWLK